MESGPVVRERRAVRWLLGDHDRQAVEGRHSRLAIGELSPRAVNEDLPATSENDRARDCGIQSEPWKTGAA